MIDGIPKVASHSGNGFVSVVATGLGASNGVAFVGNLATGTILECAYEFNSSSGKGTGQCIPVAHATSLP